LFGTIGGGFSEIKNADYLKLKNTFVYSLTPHFRPEFVSKFFKLQPEPCPQSPARLKTLGSIWTTSKTTPTQLYSCTCWIGDETFNLCQI